MQILLLALLACISNSYAIVDGTLPRDAVEKSTVAVLAGNEYCTGTIIDENAIVTAAHCFKNWKDGDEVSVYFGATAPNPGSIVQSGKFKLFFPDRNSVDIAVILKASKLPPGYQSAQVSLKPSPEDEALLIAGFGDKTGHREGQFFGNLTEKQMSVVNASQNRKTFSIDQPNGGACWGDSGGPAFQMSSSGSLELVGIESALEMPPGIKIISKETEYLFCRGQADYTRISPYFPQVFNEIQNFKKSVPAIRVKDWEYASASQTHQALAEILPEKLLESFISGDHRMTKLSLERAASLLKDFEQDPKARMLEPKGDCAKRANYVFNELLKKDPIQAGFLHITCGTQAGKLAIFDQHEGKEYVFTNYHTANLLLISSEGKDQLFVLDPQFQTALEPLNDYLSKLAKGQRLLPLRAGYAWNAGACYWKIYSKGDGKYNNTLDSSDLFGSF